MRMSGLSGLNSSGLNALFSKGSGGGIYSSLSEYNSIRSGSYGKLLNSYYNKMEGQTQGARGTAKKPSIAEDHTSRGYKEKYLKELEAKGKTADTKDNNAKVNKNVSEAANKMVSSVDSLRDSKSYSVDKSGNYDKDKLYDKVKSYVDSYNSLLSSAKDSKVPGVNSNINSMKNTTKAYEKSLSQIGITAGGDGRLSINEGDFKSADMLKVKSLFSRGSYGNSIRTNGYMAGYYSKAAASRNMYASSGNYSIFNTGNSYQSYI